MRFTVSSLRSQQPGGVSKTVVFETHDERFDIALLELGLEQAGLAWPQSWAPYNLAILNEDPVADAARNGAWQRFERSTGLKRHHALADAVALQAAYAAQINLPTS